MSPWGANTVFVPKLEVKVLRIVHDYRDVNEVTIKPAYPCHNLEADLDSAYCGRPKVFSQTDALNGFWAISIYEPDRHKTAFRAPNGMYWYNNMA